MNFFKRKKNEDALTFPVPATARTHPFSLLSDYSPMTYAEHELYSSLREAVPIIDAALDKTVRLIGNFEVVTDDKAAQKPLKDFLDSVPTTGGNRGIYPFITTYLNELLTYGEAVGEIVPYSDNSGIAALYNASLKDVRITAGDSPLELIVCKNDGSLTPAPYQKLIMPTLLNPQSGTVKGTSVLRGLPYVSGILLKIFDSIGSNWERVGNVRFAVTYKPEAGSGAVTSKQAQQIADEWSKAMRSTEVCDFISVGDVSVKVIGADNQVLDCEVPVRTLLEQIIAKLALPPFVLGISWSTSERMSTQQADILTSELEYYRTLLTPVIVKICKMFLRLSGFDDGISVEWDLINLQDEVELSQARLNNARAYEIEHGIEVMTGVEI
ncbi:MAG: serine/threonine protein phosphatase [Ruminococcus sp.]|nr:serine/threonine protein phosphatase [Ruminococcus sp.]